jgi:hypothetical protein
MVVRREQHVGGLDVGVDEAADVRSVERVRDLLEHVQRAAEGQPPLRADEAPQVGADDEAHGDEEDALLLAGVEDRDDVWMVDRRRDA